MLVAIDAYEAELEALRCEIGRIRAAVSPGYVRGCLGRGSQDEI